jgi:hypothetical protein
MVGDGPGQVPVNCKGKVVRCAARSTCGKEGFVTCQIPVPGTCDTVAHTCLNDPTKACFTDAECTTFKCKVKSATELCTAAGGTVGTSSTCCAACGS